MAIRIALAGNPNCGKTTLFNALTGSNQYVGNWPGVTVEKKEGALKQHDDVIITDLPGIYSLSPYTMEEVVARNYMVYERPDAILNIVDGTNLERNLYLTTQLIELGIPVVIAINMMDVVRKNGDKIDTVELSRRIECPIMEISALKGDSVAEAAKVAIEAAKKGQAVPPTAFSGLVEHALAHIEEAAIHDLPREQQRWYSIKIFERDEKVLKELKIEQRVLDHIEEDIAYVEKKLDDDAESIITNERYDYVARLLDGCFKRKRIGTMTLSDKIDRVVTNRVLALPIFAAIMFMMYAVAMGSFPFSIGTKGTELVVSFFEDYAVPGITTRLTGIGCEQWLIGLIADGIVSGVGSVLSFAPQLAVLYLILSVLEDVGYMSRVAFIMDRIFRKFGLSGKSFIPLLVGMGCSVPGIMASRTIEQEKDRRMTVMTTAFIPCGAKMPIVAMFAGAIFGNSAWVSVSAFFIGVAAVIVSGLILKKFKAFGADGTSFVMELPAYHAPVVLNVLRTTWERAWDFIKRAGTVILVSCVVLWFLQKFGFEKGHFGMVEEESSILAWLGKKVAVLFYPLGWNETGAAWKATVATFTGLIAKEEVVATLKVLGLGDAVLGTVFTGLTAYSFMIFNLLCAPCFAAMGAIRREMNSAKWTAATIGYMCAFAYAVSFMVYQIGSFINSGDFGVGTTLAFMLVVLTVYLMFRRQRKAEKL